MSFPSLVSKRACFDAARLESGGAWCDGERKRLAVAPASVEVIGEPQYLQIERGPSSQ